MFIPKFLQIVVLAFLSALLMVSCQGVAEVLERGAEKLLKKDNASGLRHYKRQYKLYNHCSGRHIQIIGQAVTAQGKEDSPFTDVLLETVNYHNKLGVNIIGQSSGRYLCFNKKSKLITRFSGRSPRCLFDEQFSPDAMYSTLRSVYNPEWYVGFNRRGKPLLGADHGNSNHRERCFYFTKRDHTYLDFQEHRHPGPPMPDTHKLRDYLREQRLKRRRRHVLMSAEASFRPSR